MKRRNTRQGSLFVESLAQLPEIQEKLDLGCLLPHLWKHRSSKRKYTYNTNQFFHHIIKLFSTSTFQEYLQPSENANKYPVRHHLKISKEWKMVKNIFGFL